MRNEKSSEGMQICITNLHFGSGIPPRVHQIDIVCTVKDEGEGDNDECPKRYIKEKGILFCAQDVCTLLNR